MLDPSDPAHGSEWTGRLKDAERASHFAQALGDLRAAFDRQDSRNLELALHTLREGFSSMERRYAEEASARKAAQRAQATAQKIAAASLFVGIVGVIVAVLA